jgi:hypothetical protein
MSRIAGILAATALMMGGMSAGMHGGRRSGYEPPQHERIYTPLGNTALINDIPKGHRTELIEMVFISGKKEFTFNVMISYGTEKSRLKRIAGKRREIQSYLNTTPDNLIEKRNEFTQCLYLEAPTQIDHEK